MMSEQAQITQLLQHSKVIAIVGISANPQRPSYQVAAYLQSHHYTLLLINPLEAGNTILGLPCYESLTQAIQKTATQIDIVDCFRRAELIPDIIEEAIFVNAKAVWMQQGIINDLAANTARNAGLMVIMDRCIKIDHMLLS
ncbi:CoA-binding protein [Undibacterium sp. Rencai35W]|uniref:CoA-binding protein n=1 Tax=Undibacterium sp. Rencai35W TaxID=3413046 RepID=UPI003BF350F0